MLLEFRKEFQKHFVRQTKCFWNSFPDFKSILVAKQNAFEILFGISKAFWSPNIMLLKFFSELQKHSGRQTECFWHSFRSFKSILVAKQNAFENTFGLSKAFRPPNRMLLKFLSELCSSVWRPERFWRSERNFKSVLFGARQEFRKHSMWIKVDWDGIYVNFGMDTFLTLAIWGTSTSHIARAVTLQPTGHSTSSTSYPVLLLLYVVMLSLWVVRLSLWVALLVLPVRLQLPIAKGLQLPIAKGL